MAYILSLPDGWELCAEHLWNCSEEDGRTAVQSAMRELTDLGYLHLETIRDAATGQIKDRCYVAYDDPSENVHFTPPAISQETLKTGNLIDGQSTPIKEIPDIKETLKQIPTPAPDGRLIDIPPVVHAITAEQVYAEYPRKEGRAAALKAIEKSLKSARETTGDAGCILRATQEYAAAVAQWPHSERKFIPHAATWFNRASYADDPKNWVRESSDKGSAGWL